MFVKGDKFYYADRGKGVPVKCTVLDYSHLPEIIAQREDTGEVFECREGFYNLDEYHIACIDAQIKTERNGDKKVIKKAVDDYIEELETELEEYRSIGTPEEFRDTMTKQTAMKMRLGDDNGRSRHCCNSCGCFVLPSATYCSKCGQKLDWEL